MPLRLPQPVTLDALQEMMKDPRYWNVNHPERSSWSSMVSEGFQTLFPNPIQRDETGRQTDGADGEGVVHVRAYIRTVSGQPVDVSEYDRSAPTDNEHSAQSTATTLSEENKVPAAPPGVDIDTNINEALRHTAISPWDNWWFFEQVRNRGPWDYKQQGSIYQSFGNFNYGATGAAMGYSEDILLRMAGWAQVQAGTSSPDWGSAPSKIEAILGIGGKPPFGDDPTIKFLSNVVLNIL